VFTKNAIRDIDRQLGSRSNEFRKNMKQYLIEETGWVREYVHELGQRTVAHEWNWKGEFRDRVDERKRREKRK